jgi:hypothetical protein
MHILYIGRFVVRTKLAALIELELVEICCAHYLVPKLPYYHVILSIVPYEQIHK